MKKLYFDTEFTGLHQKTTLISIGIISECGKTFYAELYDYDKTQLDDWLKENVITKLKLKDKDILVRENKLEDGTFEKTEVLTNMKDLKMHLTNWLSQFEDVEIWSDCLSYDWVLFNEIFGGAMEIPKHVNYIPLDICTQFKVANIDPDISREEFAETNSIEAEKHNSLWDAKVIKLCHEKLLTFTLKLS